MKWFLYIVKCSDGSLYTGITNNIIRRIRLHNSKLGAKSIRGKLPVTLVYKENHNTKKEAAKREKEIKGWSRKKKLNLIKKGIHPDKEEGFTLSEQSSRRARSSAVEQ